MGRADDGALLRCSFCNRDERTVAKLLAGANGFICDSCVNACIAILREGDGTPPLPRRLVQRVRAWFGRSRHGFCTDTDIVGVLK